MQDPDYMAPEYSSITSTTSSDYFTKEKFQDQIQRIKDASDVAHKKVDYITAHNEEVLYAIEIVEKFLRKSRRICYGGQAINAHLPAKHKIYDPQYSIPDYDFFTSGPEKDITNITKELQKAGFTEISVREGMHEGTMKVYVDYVPVADITAIHPKIYEILHKRSSTFDGIHYLDSNSLRMLMYLELSRPQGEVDRWSKVFERLMIFNEFIPIKRCMIKQKKIKITEQHIRVLVHFCIEHNRIFAGADLIDFYEQSMDQHNVSLHISHKKPILFFSPDSYKDAAQLIALLRSIDNRKYNIQTITIQKSDIVPFFTMITSGRQIIACIIEYSACHAYVRIPMNKGHIKIASLDTLITLYFSLGLLHTKLFNIGSMECMASKLVEISMKTRTKYGTSIIPFISVTCEGYQKTLPSLIREKVERITRKRSNEKKKTFKKRR